LAHETLSQKASCSQEASCKILAAVVFENGDKVNRLLADFAAGLAAEKVRLGGFIQISEDRGDCGCPDTYVLDLETGVRTKILQDLGAGSQGCRVDSSALAEIGQFVREALNRAPELVVFNRFGRLESEGKGLRDEIGMSVALDIPTLVAVSSRYLADWRAFVAELGDELACEPGDLASWWRSVGGGDVLAAE